MVARSYQLQGNFFEINVRDLQINFNLLDAFSLFHRLFKQYRIKNIWSPLGIEPRTACIIHKHSATELRQPAGKQHSNSVFILLRSTAMLQSHS